MSTKASFATGRGWHLYEELVNGSVRIELNDADWAEICVAPKWHAVIVSLPVGVLEAIVDAHAVKSLPHQRSSQTGG